MNAAIESAVSEESPPLGDIIQSVGRRIPPLWPLKNFVAVNPFVGLSDRHFSEAARLIPQVGHGEMLMSASFYLEQMAAGRIRENDIRMAIKLVEETLPAERVRELDFVGLESLRCALEQSPPETAKRVLTFADFLDQQNQGGWAAFVVEEISKWCSAYFDEGQSSWRMPWRDLGLFDAWKAAAQLDANPEWMGLRRFRAFVAMLPDDPLEVIDRALGKLGVPETWQPDFLHRQWMSLPGWSSYVQYRAREKDMAGQSDDSLAQLLAIRLVYDLALSQQFGNNPTVFAEWQKQTARIENASEPISRNLLARLVAQQAWECAYQSELISRLKNPSQKSGASEQRSLQAIFCIDVRSEIFRRALEAQSDEVETIGFAGFFGMPIEYLKFGRSSGSAQCPALLMPKFKVREAVRHADADAERQLLWKMNLRETANGAWNAFKTSAISCFSFVETAGLWFGVKLVKDSFATAASERQQRQFGPKIEHEICCPGRHDFDAETGIALADQIALAADALKHMGLVSDFAKIVLICGHGSVTANNPYGSALDCGACGGHAGDANSRVAAAILNQPKVRDALKAQGIRIPVETLFIAGLHNTTTDEILIFEDEKLSPSQVTELERIKGWLAAASKQARRERAASLGLVEVPAAELDGNIFARSRDWSQVRPEWGLAGNAAFIVAPRERTKGVNLGGRTFLHDYRADLDPDSSTLELIMTGPMIVASWINLQYYGSTVENRLFGSGNKVLHNVVGTFGVWQGNGGDLQPGLPLQSVHDGTRWVHEPLRLNVFIEAGSDHIATVLAKQPRVRELVENGWVNLFAMDALGKKFWRYVANEFREV